MDKMDKGCFYKFGIRSTKLYSTLSKLLVVINIVGFFYLISFTPFIIMYLGKESSQILFNKIMIEHVGPGREIEYTVKYKNKTLHCEKYNCTSDVIFSEEEEKENFSDVFLLLFYSLLACLIMFFNGESFSSDSQRINFLNSGKISLAFRPIEAATSFYMQ